MMDKIRIFNSSPFLEWLLPFGFNWANENARDPHAHNIDSCCPLPTLLYLDQLHPTAWAPLEMTQASASGSSRHAQVCELR